MDRGADARGAEADAVRTRFRPGHEFRQRARGHVLRGHHRDIGQVPHRADPGEVAVGIVRQLAEQQRVDQQVVHADCADGVAVRRGARDRLGADIARRTRSRLDHEGLAEALLHLLARKSRHHIERPARREAHDHAHRPVRPGRLRQRGRGEGQAAGRGQQRATGGHERLLPAAAPFAGGPCRRRLHHPRARARVPAGRGDGGGFAPSGPPPPGGYGPLDRGY